MEPLPKIPDFEVLSRLGYGARSTIYAVCEKRTRQIYALKRVIRRNADDDRFLQQAEQEYTVASQLSHPVLRKCHRLIRRRRFLTVAELDLLMEMFDGITLDVARPTTLYGLAKVFCQVAKGLHAMHHLGFVHADIKPNNILVNVRRQCKIIDFGQSCRIGTTKTRIQGTPDYIAPEQVALKPLTPATDVFSLGASLYWCVTDRHVPTVISGKKRGTIGSPIQPLIPPHELNPRVPAPLSALIVECVQPQPTDRPSSMDDIRARLQLVLDASDSHSAPVPAAHEPPEAPASTDDEPPADATIT